MSQDDAPETTFLALPPKDVVEQPSAPVSVQPPMEAPTGPVGPASGPAVHNASPQTPFRRQPKAKSTGAGGFSGYQVSQATTELRVQERSSGMWVIGGVALGMGLLAAGALWLAMME